MIKDQLKLIEEDDDEEEVENLNILHKKQWFYATITVTVIFLLTILFIPSIKLNYIIN